MQRLSTVLTGIYITLSLGESSVSEEKVLNRPSRKIGPRTRCRLIGICRSTCRSVILKMKASALLLS